MTNSQLFSTLALPNGATIKNRLCKAAMEENMAEYGQLPGQQLCALYRQWSEGGAGLLLTGNVMVSPNALTGAGGVVLQNDEHIRLFEAWAKAGTQNGNHFWMQISHPGRQIYANLDEQGLSPSDVALDLGNFSKMFAQPRALLDDEITDIIQRFARTASLAERSGFTGVQIHGAHGYLISQFLSPLVNRREDKWGGSLENRARFLFEIVNAVRATVAPTFCVSVKLNSADFQKGGFDAHDAKWVVSELNHMGVDLIELSGGSYESPAMQGNPADNSRGKREAYFIDFAREIAAVVDVPIMVTGGITRKQVAEQALAESGALPAVQMLGIATALAYHSDLPNEWRDGRLQEVDLPRVEWKNRTLGALATMALTKHQLSRVSKGQKSDRNASPIVAVLRDRLKVSKQAKRYRKWRLETA
ncbi:NADH:flavin oxidoreductase/NADH oxidase family protein [Arenicella sp. 4NH20-0111]|uniref:NADH:flavin oxidoreductase/NADH oxidase family protein n=1 Tax=Arenicella sp. 4NH20-0111 TaxID=3127648 RepID=UPI00310A7B1A